MKKTRTARPIIAVLLLGLLIFGEYTLPWTTVTDIFQP